MNVSAYFSIPVLTKREVNVPGTSRLIYGAVVDFQPVTVGCDFGQTIEVTQGLRATDQIVATPSDSLQEGQKVKAKKAKPSSPQGG